MVGYETLVYVIHISRGAANTQTALPKIYVRRTRIQGYLGSTLKLYGSRTAVAFGDFEPYPALFIFLAKPPGPGGCKFASCGSVTSFSMKIFAFCLEHI